MRSYTVFQFTQRAVENHSTCHAWHVCRRLPTPAIGYNDEEYTRQCGWVISTPVSYLRGLVFRSWAPEVAYTT
jgi:hypothetical protein